MHEVALAQRLNAIVTAACEGHRVMKVRLELGVLAHVDPSALSTAFSAASSGGLAEGAALEFARTKASAYCVPCGQMYQVVERGQPCPACLGVQSLVMNGDEMKVLDVEVDA